MDVTKFIQKEVTRKVIPIPEIRGDLVQIIFEKNRNKADANILSSAIQEYQKNQLVIITLDKKDWKILSIQEKIENLDLECPRVEFLR